MALELLNAATEFVDLGEWANFSSKHPSLVWLKNRRRATGEGVRSVGPVFERKTMAATSQPTTPVSRPSSAAVSKKTPAHGA